jgi:hypothetical protein
MATPERVLLGNTRRGGGVYLPEKTRTTHMQVIGASGRGKSKFLEHLIREDIRAGQGLCLIDPHGYLCEDLLRWIETGGFNERRTIEVFDPALDGWAVGFNPLQFGKGHPDEIAFGVDSMVKVCAQVWGGEDMTKTPLLKRTLRSIFYALAAKRLTLLEAIYLTSSHDSDSLRRFLTSDLPDFVFQAQWQEFNALRPPQFQEQFGSAQNRLMEFLAANLVRAVIGQQERVVDFRRLMDDGGVLLVNLAARGKLADDNARLLGALLVNDLFLKARSRPPGSRPFYLYIDECSLFINEDVGRILDEGRKFGLHLILAHQHLSQLERAGETVYSAVMTNAQTKVVFGGLSPADAEIVAGHLFTGEYDLEEAKHRYDARQVKGYVKTWLRQESESTSISSSWRTGSSESVGSSTPEEGGASAWNSASSVVASSEGGGSGASWSVGLSEALVPLFEVKPTQGYSLEEQIYRSMAIMMHQPTQHAVVKIPMQHSQRIRTPDVVDGIANDERVAQLATKLVERSSFSLPASEAERMLLERQEKLRQAARDFMMERRPRRGASFRE